MRTKPLDLNKLREQILTLNDQKMSVSQIAKAVNKDRSTVYYHLRLQWEVKRKCINCDNEFMSPSAKRFRFCSEACKLGYIQTTQANKKKKEDFYEENGERYKVPKSYAELLATAKRREPEYKHRTAPNFKFDKTNRGV